MLKEFWKKDNKLLGLIFVLKFIILAFVIESAYPAHVLPENLLFSEFFGKSMHLGVLSYYFFDFLNIYLLWLISKQINNRYSLLAPVIYCICPWFSYLTVFGSFYIYLVSVFLVVTLGLILITKGKIKVGNSLFFIGSVIAIYSSIFSILILPVLVFSVIFLKKIKFSQIKVALICLVIAFLPIFFLMVNNRAGLQNILHNEITVFSNPGILNTVNEFRGSSQDNGFQNLAKIGENKYVYSFKYLGIKFLKQLTPSTFFTSQEKLFDYSFVPPFYLSLVVPFFIGLYYLLYDKTMLKLLGLSFVLVVPSWLSLSMVSLQRLVLFSPVILFVICFGFIKLWEQKKSQKIKVTLLVVVSLTIFQLLFSFYDMSGFEFERYTRIHHESFSLDIE